MTNIHLAEVTIGFFLNFNRKMLQWKQFPIDEVEFATHPSVKVCTFLDEKR